MLAKISLPLSRSYKGFPTDAQIQQAFSKCGFDQQSRAKPGDPVEVTTSDGTETVVAGSVEHHRLLIRKNLDASTDETKRELINFGVYCGAYAPQEANIFASRVNESTLTVSCQQVDLTKLMAASTYLVETVFDQSFKGLVDRGAFKSDDNTLTILSGEIGTEIATGRVRQPFLDLVRARRVDLWMAAIMIVATFAAMLVAGGSTTPVQTDSDLTAWTKSIWPSLSIGAGTLIVTFAVNYFTELRSSRVCWNWMG